MLTYSNFACHEVEQEINMSQVLVRSYVADRETVLLIGWRYKL